MRKLGLKPRYPKRFKVTTDSHHNEAIAPNILDRNFDVVAPNKVWTTDITYVWTGRRAICCHCAGFIFAANRRPVNGWPYADFIMYSRTTDGMLA